MSLNSRVLSIYSAVGGQGVTMVATQLAARLAAGSSCCLIDLNIDFALSSSYLNVDDKLAKMIGAQPDQLTMYELPSETYGGQLTLLSVNKLGRDGIKAAIDQARADFKFVVIDLPHTLSSPEVQYALSQSDQVLLLTVESPDNFKPFAKSVAMVRQFVSAKCRVEHVVVQTSNPVLSGCISLLILGTLLTGFSLSGSMPMPAFFIGISVLIAVIGLVYGVVVTMSWLPNRKRFSDAIKQGKTAVLQNLPWDPKTSKWIVNQGQLAPQHTKLGKGLDELTAKLKTGR